MAEIIRLLTDLVAQVKRNEDLLRETQGIIKNSQTMIEQISQSAGMQNIMAASQSLETAITMLQKGVQTMQIHSTLRQVQDFLGAMGSAVSTGGSGVQVVAAQGGQVVSAQGAQPQKSGGDDNLIKPSDLFK
ncbi:MAG: hypothetical protein ACTSQI_06385 [Candidatus Helarchaeota archaeon]